MAARADSPPITAPLLNLPVELIRKIGRKAHTLNDLFNFSCINRQLNSVVSIIELCKKDAESQRRSFKATDINEISEDLNVFAWVYRDQFKGRMDTPLPGIRKPLLNALIESGKDIDTVRQYIHAYQVNYPGALQGNWYPYLYSRLHKLLQVRFQEELPCPMQVAISVGRLDIVQALMSCGVDVNGPRDDGKRSSKAVMMNRYDTRDTFYAATHISKNKEIAMFMICNGLDVSRNDVVLAARAGFVEAVEVLMKHPNLAKPEADLKGADLGRCLIEFSFGYHSCKDRQVTTKIFDIFAPLLEKDGSLGSLDRPTYLRRRIYEELACRNYALATHILKNYYMMIETPPSEADDMAYKVAGLDEGLEIIKILFSEDRWIFQDPDTPRRVFHKSILNEACAITQHMLDLGHEPTMPDIGLALSCENHRAIDMLMEKRPDNSRLIRDELHRWFQKFTHLVGMHQRPVWADGFFMVFRLIYHGATYCNIESTSKEQFERYLWWDTELWKYHELGKVETATPTRLSFAPQLPYAQNFSRWEKNDMSVLYSAFNTDLAAYIEQLHAAARLILGDMYWENLKKRLGPPVWLNDVDADTQSSSSPADFPRQSSSDLGYSETLDDLVLDDLGYSETLDDLGYGETDYEDSETLDEDSETDDSICYGLSRVGEFIP
ncbi:hypothetical protein GGS26DRAFT_593419 [Hypomontagnella submonticulosa]|nr:hypothetical protein GGS26DRAFT_593419 [Hypomontagnella submonticulosa]